MEPAVAASPPRPEQRPASPPLDRLVPNPRLVEVDRVDLAAPPERVWSLLRHGDLGRSPLVRALFAVRTLPDRLEGKAVDIAVRIDDLRSSPEKPGFQILAEDTPREFAVGAIGKVWHLEIPFVHVGNVDEFAAFSTPGFVKVAWALRIEPRGDSQCEVVFEVRVDATDDDSWRKFERYFTLIGPASHFIRRTVMAWLAHELGTPEARANERELAGDGLLTDAVAQVTDGITIAAPPERIWPWLLQMGCGRAGFYSYDLIDNGGEPSARELHPELLKLEVGQVISASPGSQEGFEVLSLDAPRALVLGGLYDTGAGKQLPFAATRPAKFWHITWTFVLEPWGPDKTRLLVRARAAFSPSERLHVAWIRPVHHFMQRAMLRHLAERVEQGLHHPA
jgi:hypothetical protein